MEATCETCRWVGVEQRPAKNGDWSRWQGGVLGCTNPASKLFDYQVEAHYKCGEHQPRNPESKAPE